MATQYCDAIDSFRFTDFEPEDTPVDGMVSCRNCGHEFILLEHEAPGAAVPITEDTLPVPKLLAAISADCATGHRTARFRSDGRSAWKI